MKRGKGIFALPESQRPKPYIQDGLVLDSKEDHKEKGAPRKRIDLFVAAAHWQGREDELRRARLTAKRSGLIFTEFTAAAILEIVIRDNEEAQLDSLTIGV